MTETETLIHLTGDPAETVAALVTPGEYRLEIPPEKQNKVIPLLRKSALARGHEAVLFVTGGQFVFFTVREKAS